MQKALVNLSSEVIVVDNASVDGSVEMVRQRFPHVIIIANDANLGFAKSSNQGIQKARGKIIVLLNPDTIVQEDTFHETIRFFQEHPQVGLLGCKILNPDGSLQLACRRSFPTPWVAFTKLSGLSYLLSGSRLFGRYNLTYLDPDQTYEVEAISGSFMAARRKTIEQVGMLDESFFMYGEDLDWCYRIGTAGWKVMYYPGTQIIHFKGESSKKAKFDSLRAFYQAMVLFAQKHFRKRYMLVPYWVLWLAIWFRAGISFFANFVKAVAAPLIDLMLLIGSLTLAIYIRFDSLGEEIITYLPVFVVYSLTWMSCLKLFGAHDRNTFSAGKASLAIFAGFLVNTSLTFFLNQYAFSRLVVLYASALGFLTVPGWRLAVKLLPRVSGVSFQGALAKSFNARSTVIVGHVSDAEALIQRLRRQVDSGYDITGFVSTDGRQVGDTVSNVPVIGGIDSLTMLIRQGNFREVIFATHQLDYDQILSIISQTGDQNVNFKLIPSNLDVILGKASIDRLDDVPLLEVDYKLHQKRYRVLKRAFDFSLATLLIILTLPLLFFKKYLSSDRPATRRIQGAHHVFTVMELQGRRSPYLRNLPYLFNIVKGEMSFVGSEIRYVPDNKISLTRPKVDLKPGLTGLAQVNRKKQLSEEDKEKYQLYYLKNYSPLLDIEIIFKTLFRL